MPELPDITVYVERIRAMAQGERLRALRLTSPFVLRTAEPRPETFRGKALQDTDRIGKRILLGFEGECYAVIHLMIAGRLKWIPGEPGAARRSALLSFEFAQGTLLMTESGSKHRASLHLVSGQSALRAFDRGAVDPLSSDPSAFLAALRRQNRTLKRALTDPTIIDGIGNAYSDEILHRARLSPFMLTQSASHQDLLNLYHATQAVLTEWILRLRSEAGPGFLEKVTAFRPEMAVHGKYGKPCPVCGAPVQRIVYAENEANYCAGCQTGGEIFADRSLSRLLKDDWPKTLTDLERLRPGER